MARGRGVISIFGCVRRFLGHATKIQNDHPGMLLSRDALRLSSGSGAAVVALGHDSTGERRGSSVRVITTVSHFACGLCQWHPASHLSSGCAQRQSHPFIVRLIT